MSTSETPLTGDTQRIIALLQPSAKPLTFGQLKKASRLGAVEIKSALEAAVKQNAIFRWPDYRRSQYFWYQSPDQAARQAVLAIASKEALPRTALIEKACKVVRGFSQQAMQRIVVDLVASRELQQVSAFTSGKLLMRSGLTTAYAATARNFIEEKLRKAGFDPAQFLVPLTSEPAQPVFNAGAQILEAIRSLEPVGGAPVSVWRLRNHLAILSKRDFDSAALELRNTQQVFLSLHHDPHNLPQEERDLLIDGGEGSFYVEIAIRK